MAKKATTTTELRRCVGSKTFGIEAHDAPISDFPVQPSRKDGLGVMCKPHWTQYTGALRRAALARKAAEPAPGDDQVAAARETPHPTRQDVVDAARPRSPRKAKASVVDATEVQKAEHAELERQLAAVGGAETDAGQAILEAAADRSASLRVGRKAAKDMEPAETPLDESIDSGTEQAA